MRMIPASLSFVGAGSVTGSGVSGGAGIHLVGSVVRVITLRLLI